MPTSQVLQHLYSLDTSSPDFLRYLYCLIHNDEEDQHLTSLRGLELTRLVNFLDDILGVAPIADDVFRRCLHKLRTICCHHAILPSSYTISGNLARVGDDPVAFGGFSDVWEGTYNSNKVCIKHLRVSEQVRETVERAFYKEAIIWKRMRHPNVVSFIGVTRTPFQFVSEWMPNGTLTEYVNENPGVDRVALLLDVAEGLNYLHANHTTHGDLKGPNILVDHSGHACLTDFGFASVVRGLSSILVTNVQGYTARWAAPEVLGNGGRSTREADVFAFAMVVVEVFTGKCPFSESTAEVAISKIMEGERPDRPAGLTDTIWDVARACWRQDPTRRPAMTRVVGILREWYRKYAADLHLSSLSRPRPAKRLAKNKDIDDITMPLGFPSAYRRINEIAEELAKKEGGLKGDHYLELLELCIRWHAVPVSYELGVVVKQGDHAQRISWVTEIWKGMHDGEVVALKVLRLSQDNPDMKVAQQRFCAGALLMKQIEHNNILPFYGVSTTATDVSLVFPWYKNGNIENYLGKNPDINRYELLLGAVEGLLFLHSSGVVHGALRPSHILIDDDGNPRLTIAAHDTSSIHHVQESWSVESIKDCSYMAPETRPRHNTVGYNPVTYHPFGESSLTRVGSPTVVNSPIRAHSPIRRRYSPIRGRRSPSTGSIASTVGSQRRRGGPEKGGSPRASGGATIESDVYEMAIVVYKVLTGVAPHCEYRCPNLTFLEVGGSPARARGVIDDLVWELLEHCWRQIPRERPPIATVYHTLKSRPKITHIPWRRPIIGELPGKLKLHVQSIRFSSTKKSHYQFYVKFKYGIGGYTTSPTSFKDDSCGYTWICPENWEIETDGRYHTQLVSLEVCNRTGLLRKDKLCATGNFSLMDSANKQIVVVLQAPDRSNVQVRVLAIAM